MEIRGILYLYFLFVASVSFLSFKKGIYLIWISFLFVPTIILEQWLKLQLPMETVLMFVSVVSEMRFEERRSLWREFFVDNSRAIFAYLLISVTIVFFSQTVPLRTQFVRLLDEIAMMLFALQTFLLVKCEVLSASVLKKLVCIAILFNLVYCVIFELVIGVNPSGLPLYYLIGQYDNSFITDFVDIERGGMSLRAQTIYRHPLSLGQYMLVLLPLFLMKGKFALKFVYAFSICCLIVLSGSRGAMAPMILVLFLGLLDNIRAHLRNLCLLIVGIVIVITFLPEKQWVQFSKEVEPFVASLQFWDDDKQQKNKIEGSSMEMRIDQLNASFREIEDNPYFGRGYGYREYWIAKHNDLHPDLLGFESLIVYYLVERGWIGLIFFFFMINYIYKLFRKETSDKRTLVLIFVGYLISIIMTGVRPLTFLFVCLTCSLVCDFTDKQLESSDNSIELDNANI